MKRAVTSTTTTGTRRAGLFLLALLALALGGGCGADTAPTTPAPPPPAPPPPPPPAPVPAPICQVGMVLQPGESCTYPGTSHTLTINPDSTASFLSATVGSSINITSGNISLRATRQSDGSWRIERVGADSGEGTTDATNTFREGDRIPDFPTGAPNVVSGGSFSLSGGVATITLGRDGYVEYPEHRYTCDASECGIRSGLVTAGVIVRTATGGGGGTSNRAPRAVGSIPDQTLTEDGSATTVNVSARFSDPDGDSLSYRASSSRTSVVRVSVSGSRVTLTPGDAGTATVTVTASDPGGLSATQTVRVTVQAAPSGGADATTFREGDRIPGFPTTVTDFFRTFRVIRGANVQATAGRTVVTIGRDGLLESADYRYTCSASECRIENGVVTAGVVERTPTGGGGTSNRAPRAVGSIPDQTLTEDGSATTVNVSARFSDPDGDRLSYQASSSRTSVVRVSVSGSRVTLTPRDAGTATVTVTATDPGGLSATQRFNVTVTASGGGEGTATFREGDRIPDFPTGVPNVVSGGSFSLSGGVVTITLRRDGYVEYSEHGYRYTCDASECGIRGGRVTAGVIVRTATGGGGAPTPTGDALRFEGELVCTAQERGAGIYEASVRGTLYAVRAVTFVRVTGYVVERNGDRKRHSLFPDILDDMSAGETQDFESSGIFVPSANATDFGCEAHVEAREVRSGQQTTAAQQREAPGLLKSLRQ